LGVSHQTKSKQGKINEMLPIKEEFVVKLSRENVEFFVDKGGKQGKDSGQAVYLSRGK
jgi:hypothetical protein